MDADAPDLGQDQGAIIQPGLVAALVALMVALGVGIVIGLLTQRRTAVAALAVNR